VATGERLGDWAGHLRLKGGGGSLQGDQTKGGGGKLSVKGRKVCGRVSWEKKSSKRGNKIHWDVVKTLGGSILDIDEGPEGIRGEGS